MRTARGIRRSAGLGGIEGGKRVRAVVLLGVSGCGKTTVGKRLAPAIGATYLEGDTYHSPANIAKMRSGTPLDDNDRKPWLEKIGHAVGDHCRKGRSVVVACSALRRQYRDTLVGAARRELTFIHLTIPAALLEERLRTRHNHFMPAALLRSQLDTLEPLERDETGTTIAETGTSRQTVDAVRRWLALQGRRRGPKRYGRHGKGRHRRPPPRPLAPPTPIRPGARSGP